MTRIAIFSSGNGSNAENIVNYFHNHSNIRISLILSDNKDAYVLERAKKLGIESVVFPRKSFVEGNDVLDYLQQKEIDFIILAGFLRRIPSSLINSYPDRIVNIHPALLPKYGGKGMYGMNVHRSVIENSEKETGITIHLVNEHYDEGQIIFQTKCSIEKEDTPESIAEKVHHLEYEYFPKTIEQYIDRMN